MILKDEVKKVNLNRLNTQALILIDLERCPELTLCEQENGKCVFFQIDVSRHFCMGAFFSILST
jgi:hypothetical protein